MSLSRLHINKLALLSMLLFRQALSQTCLSFGVDFQDGGSYFQNSLSDDDFSFTQEFEGCQVDVANNILVDPNGNEYQCDDTPLTPDDTPQLSTCPIEKSQMFSGAWSILIISNNGDADPIGYQRTFDLTVGPQQTSTYTPTVTLSATTTPIVNSTSISTYISTSTLTPSTVTSPSSVFKPTRTITPHASTTTITKTLLTLTIPEFTLAIKNVIQTQTATCVTPTKQSSCDPTAKTKPTLKASSAKFRRVVDGDLSTERAKWLVQRTTSRGMIAKRAPDSATITVTDTNTADYVTSTSTITAPATTVQVVSISTVSTTITPAPVTVYSGISTARQTTVTLQASTRTKTAYTIAEVFVTKTVAKTVTVDVKTTPKAALAACTKIGGTMH